MPDDLGASGELNEETSMEYKRTIDDRAEKLANPLPEYTGDHSGAHGDGHGEAAEGDHAAGGEHAEGEKAEGDKKPEGEKKEEAAAH